jgi:hypothetical protein
MRWAVVFGILSLAIGVFGMCFQTVGAVGSVAMHKLLGFAGMEISPAPSIIAWTGGIQAVINALLGIVLIVGAWNLLMRKPIGVKLVRTWVIARLVMVVIGFAAAMLTMKANIEWQVVMTGEIRESVRKMGTVKEADLPPLINEAEAQQKTVWAIGGATIAFAIWPLVMGYVLSRPRVKRDLDAWEAEAWEAAARDAA